MTAGEVFARLLRAHERAGGKPTRAVGAACPAPSDWEARDDLMRALERAEAAGAVVLRRGRGFSKHLVERVILADAAALYALTGDSPPEARKSELVARISAAFAPVTDEGREAFALVIEAATEGRALCGIPPDDTRRAIDTVRVLDAVFARAEGDLAPVRAFSAAALGDSKLVGRSWRRACQFLRLLDLAQAEETESDEDIAQRLGLRRALPLVNLSGPLATDGVDLGVLGMAGLPYATASRLRPTTPVSSVLTVENWESYCRHVAEARRPAEVVVYSGGWPSRAVQGVLSHLAGTLGCPFHHWGDIDPAGIRIAQSVSDRVGGARPHLMTPALAREYGVPSVRTAKPLAIPGTSAFAELAAYLSAPGGNTMEQEILSPAPVAQA